MSVLDYVGPSHHDGKESVNHSQHVRAVRGLANNDFGRAMIHMLKGWEAYAQAHQERYEDNIGSDHVIGDYWATAGLSIKRLLDGDCGGLDCGSIAHNIVALLDSNGFEGRHDGYTLNAE